MQTSFTENQLKDKDNKTSETIIRKCVHCGMCNATCPTYGINGEELEGPRGRIYLIKDMLENKKPATKQIAKHTDSCLSCYSCMTTCPSGVNYMHLIDHGRSHIEKTYKRPFKGKGPFSLSPPIHGHLVRWTRIRLSVGLSGVCNVVPISDGAAK